MNIKKFVINLDRRPDKMTEFLGRFGDWGKSVERVSAVDGMTKKEEVLMGVEKDLLDLNRFNRNKWAELGCWLSHLGLWKKLIEDDADAFMIFEDDAFPESGFENKFNNVFNNINPDFTVVFLGGKFGPGYTPPNMHNHWVKEGIFYFFNYKFQPFKRSTERTTHCYIITKHGTRLLLDELNNTIRNKERIPAVDDWLTSRRQKFKFFDYLPHITHSPHNYKTDIQV